MVIGDLALWEKTGGRSGHWRRPVDDLGDPLSNPLVNTAANPIFDFDETSGDSSDLGSDPLA
jgi:hypothetical protein